MGAKASRVAEGPFLAVLQLPFLVVSATGRLEYVFAVVGDVRLLRRVIPVLSGQTALMQELVTGNCSVEVTCLSGARVFLAWVVRWESLRNGRARQQQLVCSLNHLLFEYCLRYSSGPPDHLAHSPEPSEPESYIPPPLG